MQSISFLSICILFYVWQCYSINVNAQSDVVVELTMSENNQAQATIGKLSQQVQGKFNLASVSFLYFEKDPFFNVDTAGDVTVKSSLDLESMCSKYQQCCQQTTNCQLQSTIYVKDNKRGDFVGQIKLIVTLQDVNDNEPVFSEPSQTIAFEENRENVIRSLKPATDSDALSSNQIKSYRLLSYNDIFDLVEALPKVSLRLKRRLDHETTPEFRTQLEACDQTKCAKQDLLIQVKDENDNPPIFTKQKYNVDLKENVNVNSVIATVEATDADAGENGRVQYEIESFQDTDLQETFSINKDTGEIRLKKKLNSKIRENYSFTVKATNPVDGSFGPPNTTKVNVTVTDLNDNAPQISLVSKPSPVMENRPPRPIAIIKVTDGDKGDNAKTSCELTDEAKKSFSLSPMGIMYQLKTNREFDHEVESTAVATIKCTDKGSPPLTTTEKISVLIGDVNEFTPKFSRDPYTKKIQENSKKGTEVINVHAKDLDGTAVLTYFFEPDSNTRFFTINKQTGYIETSDIPLDRETLENITLKVSVHDINPSLPETPKKATVDVIITVIDVNDNSPVFTSSRTFKIKENSGDFVYLDDQLRAVDADKNAKPPSLPIRFSLLNIWNKGQPMANIYFSVEDDGKIRVKQSIDREMYDSFLLQVRATDTGIPSRSTLENITVDVIDVNDNGPIWSYPRDRDNVINISASMQPGDLIIKVQANDEDIGENKAIVYSILDLPAISGHRQFASLPVSINNVTGHVYIANHLVQGQFRINIRATDSGIPPRYKDTLLIVNVKGGTALNFTVIVIMITVTAIISIFLIIAIICVRRSFWSSGSGPGRNDSSRWLPGSHPGSEMAKDQLAAASWVYHPDDGRDYNPETASMMYVPGGTFPQQHHYAGHVAMIPAGGGEMMMRGPMDTASVNGDCVGGGGMPMATFGHVTPSGYVDQREYGTMGSQGSGSGLHPVDAARYYGNGDPHRGMAPPSFEAIMDGDSADSGRGGSEDDHHHYNPNDPSKGRPFSPIQFHNRPPSRTSLRGGGPRGMIAPNMVPPPATSCQCYILPEDGVIQAGHCPHDHQNVPCSRPGPLYSQHHPSPISTGMHYTPEDQIPPPMMPLGSTFNTMQPIHPPNVHHQPPPPSYDTNSMARSPRRPLYGNPPTPVIGGIKVIDDSYRGRLLSNNNSLDNSPSNQPTTTSYAPPTRPRVFNNPLGGISPLPTSRQASKDSPATPPDPAKAFESLPATTTATTTVNNGLNPANKPTQPTTTTSASPASKPPIPLPTAAKPPQSFSATKTTFTPSTSGGSAFATTFTLNRSNSRTSNGSTKPNTTTT